jgi:hypothetical protein
LTRNLYGGPASYQIRPESYPEFVRRWSYVTVFVVSSDLYDGHPNPESVLSFSLAWFQFDLESVRPSRLFLDPGELLPGICTLML